jgi:RNA polymerase sigma-70 factor (ECF subfamily)
MLILFPDRRLAVPTQTPFQELINRLRSGDASAAAEIVRTYEKEIRRTIRVRLTEARLRRTLDSMDICQSVLANFFVRAVAGQFELDQPEQVLRLLLTMAKNKVIDKARMERARGADLRVDPGGSALLAAVHTCQETPSQIAAGKELLENARRLLSEEERFLADQRAIGRGWSDLAAELGKSPEAIRKQLERALDRVARTLGLDDTAGD